VNLGVKQPERRAWFSWLLLPVKSAPDWISCAPTPHPKECNADVVAVGGRGDKSRAGRAQFRGLWVLAGSLVEADRDEGSASTPLEASGSRIEAEDPEMRRRTKHLEQENVVRANVFRSGFRQLPTCRI